MKITIIGVGNIGGAIARGLVAGGEIKAEQITCTDLLDSNLEKLKALHPTYNTSKNNPEAVRNADYIIMAVKPWLVKDTLAAIKPSVDFSHQAIISIAAGVTFAQLTEYLGECNAKPTLFRVIPNIAIEVMSSITFISSLNATAECQNEVVHMFDTLGKGMLIPENLMSAGTALASCGIAYAMRYVRAATEGGVELGFYADQAKEIVLRTVKGAADLLLANGLNPEVEIDRVTTPGGLTIKGLNAMEESGFTHSVIAGLKAGK